MDIDIGYSIGEKEVDISTNEVEVQVDIVNRRCIVSRAPGYLRYIFSPADSIAIKIITIACS